MSSSAPAAGCAAGPWSSAGGRHRSAQCRARWCDIPRTTVIVEWCDPCYAADKQNEADSSFTFGIDGGWIELLACAEHADQYNALAADLRRLGSPVEAPPIPGNVCPACGFVSASRAALSQHTRAQHNATLRQLTKESSQ